MNKYITFSTEFQTTHPRKGDPTFFKEKIWRSIQHPANYYDLITLNPGKEKEAEAVWNTVMYNWRSIEPKHHTIREGHRFKVGDKFTPKVWGNDVNPKSGRIGPYQSKQIIIAPDIEVKEVWNIEIYSEGDQILQVRKSTGWNKGELIDLERLALNDGLNYADFIEWFNLKKGETFIGQIICWNENINY